MKIEKLTDNSIRIELSGPEMEKRSLNIDKLNVDAPAYKKLMEDMLSYAEIELGFSIEAVKVNSYTADNNSKISFVLESIAAEDIPKETENAGGGASSFSWKNRKNKEPAPQLSPVFSRTGKKAQDSASGEASSGSPGGIDLAAEFMRRMMIDGYLFMQASAMKDAQEKNNGGSDRKSDFLVGLRGIEANEDGFVDPDVDEDEGGESARTGAAAIFDTRRKFQFGDDYEENGGTGLVAFASYNDLYAFLKSNQELEFYRSKLYEYGGVFYLHVFVGKKHTYKLDAIDSLAAEYRGVCMPVSMALPILEEYGEVVFDKSAMKKIRESLG